MNYDRTSIFTVQRELDDARNPLHLRHYLDNKLTMIIDALAYKYMWERYSTMCDVHCGDGFFTPILEEVKEQLDNANVFDFSVINNENLEVIRADRDNWSEIVDNSIDTFHGCVATLCKFFSLTHSVMVKELKDLDLYSKLERVRIKHKESQGGTS